MPRARPAAAFALLNHILINGFFFNQGSAIRLFPSQRWTSIMASRPEARTSVRRAARSKYRQDLSDERTRIYSDSFRVGSGSVQRPQGLKFGQVDLDGPGHGDFSAALGYRARVVRHLHTALCCGVTLQGVHGALRRLGSLSRVSLSSSPSRPPARAGCTRSSTTDTGSSPARTEAG